uniref:C3H1-type domain-containing protein n=1 Tax=Xenopsylla cheopis TaxID=163159 RepID=A0A6M2DI71_XENCH
MTSLVANYGSSSSSSNSESEEFEEAPECKEKETQEVSKLPKPDFMTFISSTGKCSVFSNAFTQEELAKKAILEKHVKMVSTPDKTRTINGKNICWNYRKGRCRFGHTCKFAHDSDIRHTEEELKEMNKIQSTVLCESSDALAPPKNIIKDSVIKKKKRPGLTQSLIPSKKVMKLYAAHK